MKEHKKKLNNFIKKYGTEGLLKISELFVKRTSNEVIAKEFNVTRQRVGQWQQSFTITRTTLRPFVKKTLNEN